jgi:hypothetical protein
VNCVERSKFGRHRLGGAVENNRVDVDKFEGGDECQDGRAPRGDFAVGKIRPEPQAIQCTKALGRGQGA